MKHVKLSKITFLHLIIVIVVAINTGVNFLNHSIASVHKNFNRTGMHSWCLIAIYLQNNNAAFHNIV